MLGRSGEEPTERSGRLERAGGRHGLAVLPATARGAGRAGADQDASSGCRPGDHRPGRGDGARRWCPGASTSCSASTTTTRCTRTSGWTAPGGPFPRGRRWSGGEPFQIRAVLQTATHDAVGYRLPVVELLPTAEEDSVVGHLGPDLLGPDWDRDEALRRIGREPDRTVGEALLDQRNLAGIGTFYRAEVLFLQGLHPRTPVAEVPDLPRLVQRAQPADAGQPHPGRAVDDRRSAVRATRVRVRTPGPALPTLRHRGSGPRSSVRPARSGAATGVRGASRLGP